MYPDKSILSITTPCSDPDSGKVQMCLQKRLRYRTILKTPRCVPISIFPSYVHASLTSPISTITMRDDIPRDIPHHTVIFPRVARKRTPTRWRQLWTRSASISHIRIRKHCVRNKVSLSVRFPFPLNTRLQCTRSCFQIETN